MSTTNAVIPLCDFALSVIVQEDAGVRLRGVRNEVLRSVDDVEITVPDSGRLLGTGVGTGAGLREPEAAELLPGGHRHEIFRLISSEPNLRIGSHASELLTDMMTRWRRTRARSPPSRSRSRRCPSPRRRTPRDGDPHEAELGHLADQFLGEPAVFVQLGRLRQDSFRANSLAVSWIIRCSSVRSNTIVSSPLSLNVGRRSPESFSGKVRLPLLEERGDPFLPVGGGESRGEQGRLERAGVCSGPDRAPGSSPSSRCGRRPAPGRGSSFAISLAASIKPAAGRPVHQSDLVRTAARRSSPR